MLLLQGYRQVEEGLGGHGEELRCTDCPIGVEQGRHPLPGPLPQHRELPGKDLSRPPV